jgi:dihydroorotase
LATGAETFDLLIQGGRVVSPADGLDGPGAVAVRGDRIVASGPDVAGMSTLVIDLPDAVVLPGLVDAHAHPAREGSKYGVDPDVEFLPRGVTTVLSQGDAGATNWERYRATTIEASRTRVRLAINLAAPGESMTGGCFENLADIDVAVCRDAIANGGDQIWGIAVNVSRVACGTTDPREVMRRALDAANAAGRPILYGIREPADWPLAEQMALLRPGDVVTYCFRGGSGSLLERGRVPLAVRAARARGVLFDVGHGMQSFDFGQAEAAIADGFPPDTISTDQYLRHVGLRPQHDLPRVMSKLLAVGMPEAGVFAAVTARSARILGLDQEIGRLTPGSYADVTALHWNPEAAPLVDVNGAARPGGCWESVLTVRAGQVVARSA